MKGIPVNGTLRFVVIILAIIMIVPSSATAQKGGDDSAGCERQPWMVVANAYSDADTSVAGALASDPYADLAYVVHDKIPSATKASLEVKFGKDPATIYVIGGEEAVSQDVVATLAQEYASGGDVIRIGGSNRIQTAARAAGIEGPCKVVSQK